MMIPCSVEIRSEEAMSERAVGQLSFADGLVADKASANAVLERIAQLVSWDEVKAVLSGLRDGPMGAPGYPALVMFKALLLQQMYGLSDPQLEELLADRLSFRRFLGLSLSDRDRITRRSGAFAKSSAKVAWRSVPSR